MNNEIKKEKKSVLNIVLNSILTLFAIIAIVFINMMSYAKGIIFGAQNSDYVNQLIEDELGIKKESIKRQADSSVVQPITYAVPTEGYVETIYINTDLSVQEVVDLLSNVVGADNENYYIAVDTEADSTTRNPSLEVRYQQGIYVIIFIENDFPTFIFSSSQVPSYNIDFVGWNSSFNGSISYESNILYGDTMSEDVYGKNNLLTPLVATVDYDEYAVPSSGSLGNVYFNKSITEDDDALFADLEYQDLSSLGLGFKSTMLAYVVATNSSFSKAIILWKDISLPDYTVYGLSIIGYGFDNTNIYNTHNGWNKDFLVNSISFDDELLSSYQGLSIGSQNKSLISFLSVQPYEEDIPIFEKFLTDASDIVLGFVTILSTAAISLSDVFIDSATNKLTIVGSALVLALAVGVIYLLFRMVRGLIKSNIRG